MDSTIPYREASATYRTILGVRTRGCGYFLAIQAVCIAAWITSEDIGTCRLLSALSILSATGFFFIVWRWEGMCKRMLECAATLENLETTSLGDTWEYHPLRTRFKRSKDNGIFKIDFILLICVILLSTVTLLCPEGFWIFKIDRKSDSQVSTVQLQHQFEARLTEVSRISHQAEQQIPLLEQRVNKIEHELRQLDGLNINYNLNIPVDINIVTDYK